MCAIVLLLSCCSDCRSSYVEMMTFLNCNPPPQEEKALAAMEVSVVGMVTAAQPLQEEQAEQLQYTCPTTDQDKKKIIFE